MTFRALAALAGLAACLVACNDPIAQSHIDANIPGQSQFDEGLTRDLRAYFQASRQSSVTVEYQLLREGPRQTGIAYPKYYAWVTIRDAAGTAIDGGAVRLAAIDKERFEVTHFLSRRDIQTNPNGVEQIFPRALAQPIRARADVQ